MADLIAELRVRATNRANTDGPFIKETLVEWRAADEIEKLRRHQSGKDMAAKAYYDNWREAEAKVAKMREVLKPFAQSLDSLDARLVRMIDRENIRGRGPDLAITLGDLRRARALAASEGGAE